MAEDRREAYYHDRMQQAGSAYSNFDRPSAEAFLQLLYTYDVFHAQSAKYMSEFGLSKSSLNILLLLRHGPEDGMQLHDLGSLLLVSRANVTGLIDHLRQRQLVTRLVDTTDRRARLAKITPNGEALLDRFMPVHYRKLQGMLHGMSGPEKKTLVHLLTAMRASMYQSAEAAAKQNTEVLGAV